MTVEQFLRSISAEKGIPVTQMFVLTGMCKSRNEARRLIAQGGIRINDCKVTDPNAFMVEHRGVTAIIENNGANVHLTTMEK